MAEEKTRTRAKTVYAIKGATKNELDAMVEYAKHNGTQVCAPVFDVGIIQEKKFAEISPEEMCKIMHQSKPKNIVQKESKPAISGFMGLGQYLSARADSTGVQYKDILGEDVTVIETKDGMTVCFAGMVEGRDGNIVFVKTDAGIMMCPVLAKDANCWLFY